MSSVRRKETVVPIMIHCAVSIAANDIFSSPVHNRPGANASIIENIVSPTFMQKNDEMFNLSG